MKGKIIDIKRFAVHDGDGIRTTLFLKGCPLKCKWCHNPESISFKGEVAYYKEKCISCGECGEVCLQNAHTVSEEGHIFDRKKCIACGKCEEVCLGGALIFYGREMTVEEAVKALFEDREFYENSGGGITLSGGECLMQTDFCREVLKKCKEEGINTAVDTCGYVLRETFDKVLPYTDTFLYDIKAIDEDVHIRCTGKSNKQILENLKYLDENGCKIEVRIPFVPGYNDGEIQKIADFLSRFKNKVKVRILPYHSFASSKYDALGMNNTLPDIMPEIEMVECAEKIFLEKFSKNTCI